MINVAITESDEYLESVENMVSVGIIGIGSYVPPKEMSNEDWADIVDTSDEWITTKTGMKIRRIADVDTNTSDLAVEACKRALKDAKIQASEIDLIKCNPEVPAPTIIYLKQEFFIFV